MKKGAKRLSKKINVFLNIKRHFIGHQLLREKVLEDNDSNKRASCADVNLMFSKDFLS